MIAERGVKPADAIENTMNQNVLICQSIDRPFRGLCAVLMLALALLSAKPVNAAERAVASGAADAVVVAPLSLVANQALNFGRIAAGTAAGTVLLNPNTLACTTTGPIFRAGVCQPAEFTGMGTRKLIVRIQMPTSVTLTRAGGTQTMAVTGLSLDTTPDLTFFGRNGANTSYQIAPPSGIFTFRIGGTLNIAANQQSGIYNGSFAVTVHYQ